MNARIDIDTKTFVRFIFVVVAFAVGILALYSARTALVILGVSIFFALALNVPVSLLSRRLPGKSRVGATALSYVAVVAALGAVIFLVIPPIIEQTAKFAQTLPSVVDTASTQWRGVNDLIDKYDLRDQVNQALVSIKDNTSTWTANVGQTVISSIGSIFSFLTAMLLVLVLTFLMLIEGPVWMRRLWNLYHNQERMEKHRRIAGRMYNVFTGYVTGQLTVSAIGAACAAIAVFILSFIFPVVPANLAMPTAAITFVLSLIPMFGATIGGLLIAVLIGFNSLPAAIVYIIYFVVYQQIENNFIAPHIQAKKIELSALAVLGSVTIGLYTLGIAGGILAIPVAGCVRVLLQEYFANSKKHRTASE